MPSSRPGGVDLNYHPAALVFRATGDTPTAACAPLGDTESHHHGLTLTRGTMRMADVELRDTATGGEAKSTSGLILCQTPGPHWGWNRGRVWTATDGSATTFISDGDVSDWTLAPSITINGTGTLFLRNGTQYRFQDGNVVAVSDDPNGPCRLAVNLDAS